MSNVNDFVTAIASGNLVGANSMFGALMQDRLSQALDDKKIELSQGIIGVEADDEVTLEDGDIENAEVSGVSGSD